MSPPDEAGAEPALPDAVRELITGRIDTVAQLEALLLLFNEPRACWPQDVVASRLYIHGPEAGAALAALGQRGLIARDDTGWRFAPQTPQLGEAVAALATLYSRRLIAITRLIHGKKARGIEAFAQAFVLRRTD